MKFRFLAILSLILMVGLPEAGAFALRGPNDASYQSQPLGYPPVGAHAPQVVGEEYRWNIPVITYGFDSAFINYFGTNGIRAIDATFKALNDLPAASLVTDQVLTNTFPLNSQSINPSASALLLQDIRSTMLTFMVVHMGLDDAENYVWCLRNRYIIGNPPITNYNVIMRNYDPITRTPSDTVNGQRFGYALVEGQGTADAVEAIQGGGVGLAFGRSVSSFTTLRIGGSFDGLTRDDVGGLRYLYSTNNFNVEGLLGSVTVASSSTAFQGSPWFPFGVTNIVNVVGGSTAVGNAIRGGIDKVTFVRVDFDSLLGIGFSGVTNSWTETYYTNSIAQSQSLSRPILRPDFIVSAGDLGLINNQIVPTAVDTGNFNNYDAINGLPGQNGPGILTIPFQLEIDFTTQFPFYSDTFPNTNGGIGNGLSFGNSGAWGFFDSTTIYQIFPDFLNLQLSDLERMMIEARPVFE